MSQIKLTADSGGGTTSIKAPSSTTSNADVVLKLPIADGSSGQVLKTDGSGQLSFTSNAGTTINNNADNRVITGSGTASTLNGESALTFDGSKLGVNRTPTRSFHVTSDDDLTSFTGTNYGTIAIENNQYDSGDYNAIDFTYSGSNNPTARIAAKITGGGSLLSFGTSNNYSSGITNEALTIDSSANVGIGTTAPLKTLTTKAGSNTHAFYIAANDNDNNGWGFQSDSSSGHLRLDRSIGNDFNYRRICFHGDGGIAFQGDTAAANALDDYEEGTYTATIYGSSTGTGSPFGMNPVNLRYTKVGRLVTVTGRVYINSSTNNPTGNARMLLPFTSADNGSGHDGQGYSYVTRYNVYSPNSDWNLVFEIEPNSSYGGLLWCKPGAAWASMSAENHTNQNAAYYGFDFSYTTAT